MRPWPGYLVANLTVAANLRIAQEREDAERAWAALVARAAAIGATLQLCHLDPDCDGSCGCGPGLFDRDGSPVFGVPPEDDFSDPDGLSRIAAHIDQLERDGGWNL